ncbi:MAG: hypothetical protein K8H88_25485, partial [Sandaracinaceae bacterium]|nr:hypothetical protein [Sandaracinaceae bacterium]
MKQGDWVRLVERGYSLDGTEEDWLGAVIEASLPLLDHGFGVVGWTFEPDLYRLPTTILGAHPDGSPHPPMAFGSRLALGFVFNRKDLENLHRADRPLITGADVMGGDAVLEHRYNQNEWIAKKVARFVEWEDWGIRDSERALGATPRGPGIGLV